MPILTKIPVASTAPVSVAFVPTTVASCRLWLDASDSATITQNATSNISQWGDKSGNGLNAVSNSVAGWALPTYVSTGAIKYVSMTPSQALHVPGFSYNTAWSVFSCMCNVTLGARWYISPYSDANIVLMGMGHGNNKVFSGMLGGGNDVTGSHIEYTSAQNTNGTGAYTYYRDGSLIDSNNTANGVPSATVRMGIGANGAAGFDADGTYYPFEIIMFNQYLGDTDRRNVEGYLAQKWGLTANLPVGHPGLTSNYLVSSGGPAPDIITFIRAAGPLSSGLIQGIVDISPVSPITATLLNTIATYLRNYMSEFRNPSFYGYALDGSSYYINDGGGNDMYDAGNWTYPWLISGTQYTGASGSQQVFSINYASTTATTVDTDFVYVSLGYTQSAGVGILSVHPLTVLGFRTTTGRPVGFQLGGNSGADGGGTLSSSIIYAGDVIQGFTVHAFYRETYNATDPSHCNLFILLGHPSWGSVFGTISSFADPVANGGNGCYFYTSGAGVSNILAIQTLLSKASGVLVTAAECQTVVQAFVNRVKLAVGF